MWDLIVSVPDHCLSFYFPYMVKTLKNLLLWNQKTDDLETWYAASGAQILPSLFK